MNWFPPAGNELLGFKTSFNLSKWASQFKISCTNRDGTCSMLIEKRQLSPCHPDQPVIILTWSHVKLTTLTGSDCWLCLWITKILMMVQICYNSTTHSWETVQYEVWSAVFAGLQGKCLDSYGMHCSKICVMSKLPWVWWFHYCFCRLHQIKICIFQIRNVSMLIYLHKMINIANGSRWLICTANIIIYPTSRQGGCRPSLANRHQ